MNTCARIESTGIPNRIHLSQATADLLVEASKSKWVKPRDELVHAKGKGYVNVNAAIKIGFGLIADKSSNSKLVVAVN